MTANVYSFPDQTAARPFQQPVRSLFEIKSTPVLRLEQLERHIRTSSDDAYLRLWLDEYLDIGLELANIARHNQLPALQESWLKRLYRFLRDTAFRLDCCECCRTQCLEHLYQPYFALRHIYQAEKDGDQKIRRMNKDLEVIARYVL